MIEGSPGISGYGSGLQVEHRPVVGAPLPPVKDASSATPQRQERPSPEEMERVLSRQIEGLRASQDGVAATDSRTRRAMAAYVGWHQNENRDYLTRVFGVDEFV